jgi:hypothetical protein
MVDQLLLEGSKYFLTHRLIEDMILFLNQIDTSYTVRAAMAVYQMSTTSAAARVIAVEALIHIVAVSTLVWLFTSYNIDTVQHSRWLSTLGTVCSIFGGIAITDYIAVHHISSVVRIDRVIFDIAERSDQILIWRLPCELPDHR